ncbi:MAG TPA: ATP-dependent DNA helicase [Kofleriaceae bacterium]|nr:ATP-dependent DNA helicase [Kofleriaceae bacterium]
MSIGPLLVPGGSLARAIDEYEDRPQQRAMAGAVEAALEDRRPLLCEAGTGTGKTLAYLLPAAASGLRVVVSTGTRALQEQLTQKDIPLAARALGRPIQWATLKGVSNYLCRRRAAELELYAASLGSDSSHAEEIESIREWMLATETGDRGEMGALGEESPWWERLTVTPETRLGARCPHFETCFVTMARRRAEKSSLIVVNHHLYFADLALRASSPGARVLPDHDAVVFDEAHLLEDVMTEHFSVGVSTVRTSLLARDLRDALLRAGYPMEAARVAGLIERSAGDFFGAVWGALGALFIEASRVALPEGLFASPEVQAAWFGLDNGLEAAGLRALEAAETTFGADDDARAAREQWQALARRADGLRDALATLADPAPGERSVSWGETRGRQLFLRAAPVDVAAILRERVLSQVPAAVFTSATLTCAGRFGYVRERLGLPADDCDEVRVDSPFDYASQALLYVARDLPAPGDSDFLPAACARIAELLDVTEGRAFVLFTSHRALREAEARLSDGCRYPLLVQGQAPPALLLDRFRATPGAVLLATGTFWSGVDIPGPALSLVIMDKLPFASPGDPLTAARAQRLAESGRDPFHELHLPQAALAFRQGFGRLIRRRDDRGIAAVLDGRLVGRAYGRFFTDSLPRDLPRTSILEKVRRWWRGDERGAPAPRMEAEAR